MSAYPNKSMLIITSQWGGAKTFKMLPLDKECPYIECIYDPTTKYLAVISKEKKSTFQMIPKLDDSGQPLKSAKGPREERRMVDIFHEYYITDKDEILNFVKLFGWNSDTYDLNSYFS